MSRVFCAYCTTKITNITVIEFLLLFFFVHPKIGTLVPVELLKSECMIREKTQFTLVLPVRAKGQKL
jgi:hypothetical protein